MRYWESDYYGSFTARDTGFLYEYDARAKALCVSRAGGKSPLLCVAWNMRQPGDALEFVTLLGKTLSIKALQYSDNATINLAGTVDDLILSGLLEGSLQLARYALDLRSGKFELFQQAFLKDTDLKRIEIKKVSGYDPATAFYVADAETRRGNSASARSSSLHAAMNYLSDKFIRDIIPMEIGCGVESWGNSILHISSLLAMLSLILNDRFDPSRKIGRKGIPAHPALLKIHKNSILQ